MGVICGQSQRFGRPLQVRSNRLNNWLSDMLVAVLAMLATEVRQLVECWVPSIGAWGKQAQVRSEGVVAQPGEVRNCVHQSITVRSLTEWPGTQAQACR